MLNEHDFELKVIKYFEEIGYKYITSSDLLNKRKDLGTVILFDVLEEAIKNINKDISQAEVNSIIAKVRSMDDISLFNSNKNAINVLSNGIKIRNEIEDITKTFKIIDYDNVDNNNYVVTNQFKMISSHQNYDNQIPDMVVYINGLPISVIELKSPSLDDVSRTIDDAYFQMKNYQGYMPTLFTWNIINSISNKHINRYGSLTAHYARYSNWRSLKNDKREPDKYFFQNLYNKQNILTIVKDFSFYTSGDDSAKIVAGYHQIKGVKEASKQIINAIDNKTKKAGIFWHTQGSGKSLSMVFMTRYVNNIKKKLTTLIITDRKDLDNQLSATFLGASDYLNQEVKQIDSINDLKNTLNNKVQNGIYLCTVQKFDETIGELSGRDDILIISDEAHRSHKNINGKLAVIEDEMKVEQKYGYAYYLREAFPKATFIGFTGTPIETDDYQTKDIFGDYATKYLMSDAEIDGFVVPIKYESRHAQLKIVNEKKKELDELYANIRDDIVNSSDLKADVQKHLNKKVQKMDMIIGDDNRIEEIVNDFVKHYKTRQNLLKGKAMFVAYNREIAFKYYYKIIKKAPELKENIRLILTANNQKDTPDMIELIKNDKYRKESAEEFKKPNSDFKIAIVVDMWLTGFDAPSLDTIYLDKPIKMHNLMQTIARVNRTYTDKNDERLVKEAGLVVDYIGLWKKLQEALEFYTIGGKGLLEQGPEDIEELKGKILTYTNNIYVKDLDNKIIMNSNKRSDTEYLFELVESIQRIVVEKKIKQLFVNKVKKLTKAFVSIITICTEEEKLKMQLLITARSMLIKRELGELDIDLKVKELKKLIAESIVHNKTIISDNIDGEEVSLTNIINYIKDIAPETVDDELQVEKLRHAVFQGINSLKNINMVREEKLTLKLQVLLDKYDSNHITAEEFVEGLKQIGHEIQNTVDEVENSDKDRVELAFFEILLDDEYSKSQYDKDKIEKITNELFTKVKPLLTKRWLYNESIKETVRAEMFTILILNDYPPEATKELQDNLVKQLELQINTGIYQLEEEN